MWSLISAIQVLLPGLLMIAVVWRGVQLARDGRIEVGELVTVYSAVMLLTYPLRHFEEIAMAYSFSRPSARRAARVLSLERAVDSTGSLAAEVPDGDLYDPVTGLLAPAGRLTAVVCGDPDAAGLLAERLGGHASEPEQVEEPEAGRGPKNTSVVLGGVPLDELPLESARTAVLVQDKDPVLLSGSLRELLDVPASGLVSAEAALSAAQCADVLDALAQGALDAGDPMDARITERGRSLSGGQRQRLALARALLADFPVLVLDEPAEHLDLPTADALTADLLAATEGRTTLLITHRLAGLDAVDEVVVLAEGGVVQRGAFAELSAVEGPLREMVDRERAADLLARAAAS
jgi:putative ABC transport system ATP-binding protein